METWPLQFPVTSSFTLILILILILRVLFIGFGAWFEGPVLHFAQVFIGRWFLDWFFLGVESWDLSFLGRKASKRTRRVPLCAFGDFRVPFVLIEAFSSKKHHKVGSHAPPKLYKLLR